MISTNPNVVAANHKIVRSETEANVKPASVANTAP